MRNSPAGSGWYGSVLPRRERLEESVLERRRMKSVWEGLGGVAGDEWRLRMKINVSWFSWDES